jgi:hypothetical protein
MCTLEATYFDPQGRRSGYKNSLEGLGSRVPTLAHLTMKVPFVFSFDARQTLCLPPSKICSVISWDGRSLPLGSSQKSVNVRASPSSCLNTLYSPFRHRQWIFFFATTRYNHVFIPQVPCISLLFVIKKSCMISVCAHVLISRDGLVIWARLNFLFLKPLVNTGLCRVSNDFKGNIIYIYIS